MNEAFNRVALRVDDDALIEEPCPKVCTMLDYGLGSLPFVLKNL